MELFNLLQNYEPQTKVRLLYVETDEIVECKAYQVFYHHDLEEFKNLYVDQPIEIIENMLFLQVDNRNADY